MPAGIVFLILLLRYDLYRADRHPKRAYLLLAVAGLFAATWIVLTFTSPDILHSSDRPTLGPRGGSFVKAVWTTLFGWTFAWTVRPFAVELPFLGVLTAGALIYNVFVHRHEPLPALLRQPWLACDDRARVRPGPGALLEFTLLVPPLPGDPLFDCRERRGSHRALARLARPLPAWNPSHLAAFAFLGLFSLTSDFNPRHLARKWALMPRCFAASSSRSGPPGTTARL